MTPNVVSRLSTDVEAVAGLSDPAAISYTIDARLDVRMLVFCAGLSVMAIFLLTLAPAWRSLRPNIVRDLKIEGAQAQTGRTRFRAQHAIVGVQATIGVVVLVATALMVRSVWHGATLRAGFDSDRQLATLYLVPALQGYDRETTHRFFEAWRQQLKALPSVQRVSYAIRLPAQANESGWSKDVAIPGVEPSVSERTVRIRYTTVGPDYFEVMGTAILSGRGFSQIDGPDSPAVVIINETMARRFWPGDDPIGKTIAFGSGASSPREIVGIAEDIKIADLYEPPESYLYVAYAQDPQGFGLLLVETALEPEILLAMARTEIARLAPDLPVLEATSLDGHMKMVLFEERRDAWIAMAVGFLALALTASGIYGLVTMIASHRTKEIGIRVVLGASSNDVLWLVIRRSLGPAMAGSVAGIGTGLMLTRYLESRVHGIATNDPLSFALGATILLAVVILASLVPALRAARLDPSTTIRCE